MALHDLAKELSTTTGTADAVLSGAVDGCNTWDDAGVTNGESVKYGIVTFDLTTHRPIARELGTGTYTTSTKTVARTSVVSSSNGGSKITMTGLSHVYITPRSTDYGGGGGGGSIEFAVYQDAGWPSSNLANNASANPATIDTQLVDASGLVTLSSNVFTFNFDGWYAVEAVVYAQKTGGGALGNGEIDMGLSFSGASNNINAIYPAATATNATEAYIHFGGSLNVTSGDTLQPHIDNFSGVTIDTGFVEIRFEKLG